MKKNSKPQSYSRIGNKRYCAKASGHGNDPRWRIAASTYCSTGEGAKMLSPFIVVSWDGDCGTALEIMVIDQD